MCRASTVSLISPVAASEMAKVFVDEEIKKPAVVFSKSYCSFCKMAKNVLNEIGAKYTTHELDNRGGSLS